MTEEDFSEVRGFSIEKKYPDFSIKVKYTNPPDNELTLEIDLNHFQRQMPADYAASVENAMAPFVEQWEGAERDGIAALEAVKQGLEKRGCKASGVSFSAFGSDQPANTLYFEILPKNGFKMSVAEVKFAFVKVTEALLEIPPLMRGTDPNSPTR